MQNLKLYYRQKEPLHEAQPDLQTQLKLEYYLMGKTTTLKTKIWHPDWLYTLPGQVLQENWKKKESKWLAVLIEQLLAQYYNFIYFIPTT